MRSGIIAPCLITADWLCSPMENSNQQPSPEATDSSSCPFGLLVVTVISASHVPFLSPAYPFVNIPFIKFFSITWVGWATHSLLGPSDVHARILLTTL